MSPQMLSYAPDARKFDLLNRRKPFVRPATEEKRPRPFRLLLVVISILLVTPLDAAVGQDSSVLVFSKTEGFRHASIEDGVAMIEALGSAHGFGVDHTEDASQFTDANLAEYAAVVFLSTTGDVLNADQQEAFERYVESGGGFVGIHAAADTEYNWPWYGDLVGAYFESHPPSLQSATVVVNDRVHPSTEMLPLRWERTDEWYNYQSNPRGDAHVLLTLDESTYSGGTNGHDHPIAWCRPFDEGRSWYTGGGHTSESYGEPHFKEHVLGGILWATGAVEGDCSATLDQSFERTILDSETNDPMELTVLPDGRVVYVERGGAVKVYDPAADATTVAARLSVYTGQEDGLLGITQDPSFEDNGWIYLFYSPSSGAARQRISRFTLTGDDLNLTSEEVFLEIPTQREQCCHSGGSLAFGPDGNLFASLGDDTNPFDSDGFAPIDERNGRQSWDAQRTSGNTQDLRGKILRITPQPDGTYTIPEGNLFSDPSVGRPEIYVMGSRNPFRIALDGQTGWLYWGDVGPDSRSEDVERGPIGYDEYNQAREAGNFGWPYCLADNQPYRDFDFATRTPGAPFDCAAGPTNDSPNNDGVSRLPPARPAWIWYPYGVSETFPELEPGGRTAMAGPVYHFDRALSPQRKLPAYYDGTVFIYEWSRHWIKEVKLDDQGEVLKINPFLDAHTFRRPMDMEMGPDGAIYLLEWGTTFNGGNDDSRLVRISYDAGPEGPVAVATAEPTAGPIPLTVQFSASESYNPFPDGELLFEWDFDGDGTTDESGEEGTWVYQDAGTYTARLIVSGHGYVSIDHVTIVAGNSPPVVAVSTPPEGGIVGSAESVAFDVSVTDTEDGSTADGSIACADVHVTLTIVSDGEATELEQTSGCEGALETAAEDDLEDGTEVHYVVSATYTDQGAPNEDPLVGEASVVLQPQRKEAEHFTTNSGVELEETTDPTGGVMNVGWIDHGDYLSYYPVNLAGIDALRFRVASEGTGGQIQMRVDGPDGPLVGSAGVFPTGGWQSWANVTADISDPGGTHELFLVFVHEPGSGGLFNLNYIVFEGPGVSVEAVEPVEQPSNMALADPYPNPMSRGATFTYDLAEFTDVRLEIYDVLGRRVETLVDDAKGAGTHRAPFDGDRLASGVYFIRLATPNETLSRRFVVTR